MHNELNCNVLLTMFLFDCHPSRELTNPRPSRLPLWDVIAGFETPYEMELLSTVLWVASREGATSKYDAVAKTHAWSERKRMFTPEQIGIAWDTLLKHQWIGHPSV